MMADAILIIECAVNDLSDDALPSDVAPRQ